MADIDTAIRHFRAAREHLDKAEAALVAPDPAGRQVLEILRGEMALAEIQRATGLSHDAAAQACSRLAKRGEIRRVRHGVYAAVAGAGERGRSA